MNFKLFSILLIFLISSSFYLTCNAQEESATPTENSSEVLNATKAENETEPVLVASPDVVTSFVFPNSTTKREFVVATEISVVIALTNKGSSVFNVTRVTASFVYPQDHRYFIQNFTRKSYDNESVNPEELRSFLYKFSPDPFLEPREYSLVISIFYHDLEGGNFTSVVFNSTITLLESDESIDAQALFTYVGVLGVVGLVGFVVYKSGKNLTKKGRKFEQGTQRATVIDNEWLQGTSAEVKSPKNVKSPKLKPKTN